MKDIVIGFRTMGYDGFEDDFDKSYVQLNDFLILDQKITEIEISIFINSLLTYTSSTFNDSFIKRLSKKEELALNGGLIFRDNENIIFPSCCADFQDWKPNIEQIRNKQSPWMGHDPDVGIEFIEDEIIVWSDESNKNKAIKITYNINEIDKSLKEIINSLAHILKVSENWIEKYSTDKKQKFLNNLTTYLML